MVVVFVVYVHEGMPASGASTGATVFWARIHPVAVRQGFWFCRISVAPKPTTDRIFSAQIVALGTNVKFLTNAALGALTGNNSAASGQIAAITAAQIMTLSLEQIGVIAAAHGDTGVAQFNMGAFASLTPAQIAILTTSQKAKLSPAQHTSCGC